MHRTSWTASIALLSTLLSSAPALAQCPQSSLQYSFAISGLVDAANVSVSSIQDLDNDGARDLIVGIPGGPFGGRVEIWSTLGQTQILSFAPPPLTPKTSFGWDVVAVDDMPGDLDALEDVLVGAPHDFAGASPPGTIHGVAFVYSSSTGALLHTIQPSATWVTPSRFGWSVARGGPINGNPGNEVLIGAPGYRGSTGLVDCVDIAGASPTLVGTLPGTQVGEQFGFSVAGMRAGGLADVAVGAPSYVSGCGNTGTVHVFSGAALGAGTVATVWTWAPCLTGTSDDVGYALASVGDYGGDGVDELAIGAPSTLWGVGTAMVLNGSTGAVVAAYTDVPYLGWSCARISDQDCDGKPDALFGAPKYGVNGVDTQRYVSGAGGSWLSLPYPTCPLTPPPCTASNFGVDVTGLGVPLPMTQAGGFAVVDASALSAPALATIYVYY